jgi:hypothetical protein
MIGLSDTTPDVERRMYEAYRVMPPSRKWNNLFADYRLARSLHAAGMRRREPEVSVTAIQSNWIRASFGSECPVPLAGLPMEPIDQEVQPVLKHVIQTLDRLRIAYAIGGSIASSLHGVGRLTRDADLTVEPFFGREAVFVSAFDPNEYYLSPDAVRDALRLRSSFNILHPTTGYKIDIFIRKDESFERMAFSRRVPYEGAAGLGDTVQVHSPEDIILFKLRWFRMGGETSERQWSDIHGVLMTQGDRLDAAYMDHWAAEIGVKDLLDRARAEC